MRLLLLALLLPAFSFAYLESCTVDVLSTVISEQGALLAAVISLGIAATIILYLAGRFFERPEYVILAQDEMYHLVLSAIFLVCFGGVIAIGCIFSQAFIEFGASSLTVHSPCPTQVSPIDFAGCSLSVIEKEVDSMIYQLTKHQLKYLQDAGWAYSAGDIIRGSTKTTYMESYKRVYASEIDIILNTYIFPARLSVSIQKVIVKLIRDTIVAWILPIAFVFRFFPPFRSAGNILLGICLALYAVFPLFLVFNFFMYYSVFDDCGKYASIFADKPLDRELGLDVCASPLSLWMVARLVPMAFFLPNLTIALTITFVMAVDKALRVIG